MYKKLFINHPQSVNVTYFEHAQFALRCSSLLFLAAFAALFHAIIRAFFEKTASSIIASLYHKTHNRGRKCVVGPVILEHQSICLISSALQNILWMNKVGQQMKVKRA